MKLFLGEYGHSLDERGRVTLPKKIRQELTGLEVIVAKGFDTCVFVFDREEWESEAKKHLEMSLSDKNARDIRRYLFSSAEALDIDKLGRILVPAHLKEYAVIQKDLTIVGAGDHFELWDHITWVHVKESLKAP